MEKAGSKTKSKDQAEPKSVKRKHPEDDDLPEGADPRPTPYHKRSDKEKDEKANTLPAVIKDKEEKNKKEQEEKMPVLHRHQFGRDVSVHNHHERSIKEVRAERVAEHSQVAHEIATLNRDSAAVINPHSIKALQHIKPQHLITASRDIDTNRRQITDVVAQRVQEHPKLFDRGLKALDKTFQGAKKLRPKDAQAGKRVLTQIAIAALLGTSVLALTMGAAPLAVVSARILWDVWHHHKKKTKEQDDKKKAEDEKQKRLGNDGAKPVEGTSGEADDQISAEEFAKKGRKGKAKKKKGDDAKDVTDRSERKSDNAGLLEGPKKSKSAGLLEGPKKKSKSTGLVAQPRKPKKQKHWTEEESEDAEYTAISKSDEPFQLSDHHDKTINLVLDQLSDVLKYQSPDEFKELSDQMFSKANAESESLYTDIYNAVAKLATGRLSGIPGTMLYGLFNVNIVELSEICERVCQVEPEIEIEDGQKCFHFETPRGLVTLGLQHGDTDNIQFMITEVQ